MNAKKERLSVEALQALADQYGGLPDDDQKKVILAPVLRTIPREQRPVFFQILDTRRNIGDRAAMKK